MEWIVAIFRALNCWFQDLVQKLQNQAGLLEAELREARSAKARLLQQKAELSAYLARLAPMITQEQREAVLWEERALAILTLDEDKALECLRREAAVLETVSKLLRSRDLQQQRLDSLERSVIEHNRAISALEKQITTLATYQQQESFILAPFDIQGSDPIREASCTAEANDSGADLQAAKSDSEATLPEQLNEQLNKELEEQLKVRLKEIRTRIKPDAS